MRGCTYSTYFERGTVGGALHGKALRLPTGLAGAALLVFSSAFAESPSTGRSSVAQQSKSREGLLPLTPRSSGLAQPQYFKPRRNQPLPARRCEPNQSLRVIRSAAERASEPDVETQASAYAVTRSGGARKPPSARAARANHGLRASHLSKPTPQNGQNATRRPKRYWLAICIPSLDLQLGHLVRSRYSNAPAMLATPSAPTAASK